MIVHLHKCSCRSVYCTHNWFIYSGFINGECSLNFLTY